MESQQEPTSSKNAPVLSFDTLFEILRNERNKEDLAELPDTYYHEVTLLIRKKEAQLEGQGSQKSLMSNEEQMHQRMVISNIKKIVTEIYERREKKIITLAMNKSRTKSNVIDTSHLLKEEGMFFHDMVQLFDAYKDSVLQKVLHGAPLAEITKQAVHHEEAVEEAGTPGTKTVRFTQPVPKFLGKELEVYGPFAEDDIANLPEEIADVLIKKGRAEEML